VTPKLLLLLQENLLLQLLLVRYLDGVLHRVMRIKE
jgi:hypothetical protein